VTKYQKEPTDEELIELTNLTQKQYSSTIIDKSYCQSLESPINDSSTIEDVLSEDITPFSDNFTKETVSKALKCLNPREYKVITEFYGLDNVDERPIKEIAKELNLGDERVRQIRKTAVKKLNKRCGKVLKTLL
jgi:RNA polymerase primary sigma factor